MCVRSFLFGGVSMARPIWDDVAAQGSMRKSLSLTSLLLVGRKEVVQCTMGQHGGLVLNTA